MTLNKTTQIWTNGLYVIEATLSRHIIPHKRKLIGHIIYIENPLRDFGAYKVGDEIEFPLYYTSNDKTTQFYLHKQQVRNNKIDELLKNN